MFHTVNLKVFRIEMNYKSIGIFLLGKKLRLTTELDHGV